ncbi:MAG: YeiH family protein [Enterococcus sp.]
MHQKIVTGILPGLGLAFLVAAVSKGVALYLPQLGGATIAILLGIVLGNTVFKQEIFAKGTKFSESKLLEISVVLLGVTVTFQTIQQLGMKGLDFIILQMVFTILGVLLIGKKLRFNQTMCLLMAGGNAVCGSSAIASISPVIHAKDEEKGQIITLVNLLGTVMMLSLPILGAALFGNQDLLQGALLGGTLQSVGQVVAGASMVNQQVVQYATLFKIMRIIFLALVVLVFERLADPQRKPDSSAKRQRKIRMPWYVSGFLVCCVLNSLIDLPVLFSESAHLISTWFETMALAAIGLRLNLKKFLQEGPRFLAFGATVGLMQTGLAFLFIKLLAI